MKLRSVKFKDHPIFKDLELSFVKDNSNDVFDTIIFAGENGVGKSILLDVLYNLASLPIQNSSIINLIGKGSYEIELSQKEIQEILLVASDNDNNKIKNLPPGDAFFCKLTVEDREESYCKIDISIPVEGIYAWHLRLLDNANKIKGIFLDTQINFESSKIHSITAQQVDSLEYNKFLKPSSDFPREIKQLFIDLYNQDNMTIIEANESDLDGRSYHEIKENIDLKINRFKTSFRKIIKDKEMIKSIPANGSHQVVFRDLRNNKEIFIDNLSSGEKQIIYRGAFLLRNQKILDNAIIFIDEPETSLHPDWQIKILEFYKNILTSHLTNKFESQLFVVTHSPFILHNTDNENDKVIILRKDNQGSIAIEDIPEFYNYTYPELIKKAFRLPQGFLNKDVIYVEGETDEKYIKKAVDIFQLDLGNIEISCIGEGGVNGSKGTGESNLKNALKYLGSNNRRYNEKYCFLFDCDISIENIKKYEVRNKLIIRKHEKINNNRNMTKGIENLIVFPGDLTRGIIDNDFYISYPKDDGYGRQTTHEELDKKKLAEKICSYSDDKLKEILINVYKSVKNIIDEMNVRN